MNRRDFFTQGSLMATAGAFPAVLADSADQQRKEQKRMVEKILVPHTSIHRIEADGVTVFYREAGPRDAPVVLLLHGFPTSSFQYRALLSKLAENWTPTSPE